MKKKIFVFGNPDLPEDSLPIEIMPKLKELFPMHEFISCDPNEEWDVPEDLVVIDTVQGLNDITCFNDLNNFQPAPNFSMHDFDAYANLRLLKKLEKLKNIFIIGIPQQIGSEEALDKTSAILRDLEKNR